MLERVGTGARGRTITATLRFTQGGGRTFLGRQFVPYPFHVTRPHMLDPDLADMATLILQSASGGLYRGDQLVLELSAGEKIRAHVRSQAATVVHAARGGDIAMETRIETGGGAFLAVTTDPYVLFPGTALEVRTSVMLQPGAVVLLSEGFAMHDPSGAREPFDRLSTQTRVTSADGTSLLEDNAFIAGTHFSGSTSPLGPYRAMGAVMLLGHDITRVEPARMVDGLDQLKVLAGVTALPNRAGLCVRLLAVEGGRLARGLEFVQAAAFAQVLGQTPPPRRA